MSINKQKILIWQEIYEAISYFIERQHLVAQAMGDLGLDLDEVGKWGTAAWSSAGSEPYLDKAASDEEGEGFSIIMRARGRKVPQSGSWGDKGEWSYFLHGSGCRLWNVHTGEVINWDCPNISAFDPYSFLEHLRWRLEVHHQEEELYYIQEWIQKHPEGLNSIISLIEEMIEADLINQDYSLSERGLGGPVVA